MLKEFAQYIGGLHGAKMFKIGDENLADTKLFPIRPPSRTEAAIAFTSLEGFSEYLDRCAILDGFSPTEGIIVIEGVNSVVAYDKLDKYLRRPIIARLEAHHDAEFRFELGQYMAVDAFIIGVKTHFYPVGGFSKLLKAVSGLVVGSSQKIVDNGITQTATVKQGAELIEPEMDAFINLAPRRTFASLGPIESEFFIRLKPDGNGGVKVGIWESTFKDWSERVREKIKAVLQANLPVWIITE